MNLTHLELPMVAVHDTWIIPASHIGRKIGCSTNRPDHVSDFAHVVCRIERDSWWWTADQASSNAALIVKAVNAHDALVVSLKEMTKKFVANLPDHCNADWYDEYNRAVAVLAAAGEQV